MLSLKAETLENMVREEVRRSRDSELACTGSKRYRVRTRILASEKTVRDFGRLDKKWKIVIGAHSSNPIVDGWLAGRANTSETFIGFS
jgi:hypothetical protein